MEQRTPTTHTGEWCQAYWLPLLLPNGGISLACSVWHPHLGADELIGADFLDVSGTPTTATTDGLGGLRWVQLYAPLDASSPAAAEETKGGVWTGALLIAVELREEAHELGLKARRDLLTTSPAPLWLSPRLAARLAPLRANRTI